MDTPPQSVGSDTTAAQNQSAVLGAAQQAASSLGVPFTRIDPAKLRPEVLKLVDETLAREYRVLPLSLDAATKRLVIAVADPSLLAQPAPAFLQQLKQDGYQLEIEITTPSDFEAAVGAYASYESRVTSHETAIPVTGDTSQQPSSDPVLGMPAVAASQAMPPSPAIPKPAASVPVQPQVAPPALTSTKEIPPSDGVPKVESRKSKLESTPTAPTISVAPAAPLTPYPSRLTQPATQSQPASPVVPTPQAAVATSPPVPAVSLGSESIPASVLARFPADVARKYKMVVYRVSEDGKVASVGAVNPDDRRVREILKFVQERNNLRIELGKISQADLDRALAGYETEKSEDSPLRQPASEGQGSQPPSPTGFGGPGKSEAQVQTADDRSASADASRDGRQTAGDGQSALTSNVSRLASPSQVEESQTLKDASSQRIPSAQKPDLKLASSDVIKAAVKTPQVVIPSAPTVTAAAPAIPPVKIGPVTPVVPPTQSEPKNLQPALSPVSTTNQPVSQPTEKSAPPPVGDERNLDSLLGSPVQDAAQLEQIVKAGMVPKIVAAIVSLAVSLSASDIHIEAARAHVRIRLRIDGELQEVLRVPVELLAPLVSRLKILAKLKIDESRIPQDGRFDVWLEGREIDLRVSTLPTIHGEKVVLRILDKTAGIKSLEDLGVSGSNLARLKDIIDDPYGIILVSGPTGSGKTSTLYALLAALNKDGVNIVTLEDPVEYQLEGVNQTQVKPTIGFGFADGLRSILRQDPNIIMVGEIRDQETAALATQAALTGHLVLSTLHTNDAAGAIPRMIDMGVEPFLLASSLKAIIGQRLVRRLKPDATQPATVSPEVLSEIKQSLSGSKAPEMQQAATAPMNFLAPNNGRASYHGRVGIYEVLTMSDAITALTLKKAVASSISEAALSEGMVTMRQDGILKAQAGVTSLEEVLTATADK